jgi:hypothetical protein
LLALPGGGTIRLEDHRGTQLVADVQGLPQLRPSSVQISS